MNKIKRNMQMTLICIIFLLQVVLIVFSIIIVKQLDGKSLNYETIEFEAETMEEIENLKQYKKPIIVVFGADYCPTCRNYMPYIKELYEKYKDKVIIKYIDTVKHESIRKVYNIEIIPSTIIYDKNGEIYKPSKDVDVYESTEEVDEKRYQSENIILRTGESLGLNNNFEYGQDENGRLVYTKYTGLIDLVQLEKIIEELLY